MKRPEVESIRLLLNRIRVLYTEKLSMLSDDVDTSAIERNIAEQITLFMVIENLLDLLEQE